MTHSRAIANGEVRLLPSGAAYALLVGIPAVLVALVLRIGAGLPAAPGFAGARRSASAAPSLDLGLLVLQIVAIICMTRVAGRAVGRLGQPRVVGEMLAGLVLGPSVLGRIAPGLSAALFPATSLGFVNALAQLGLLLFMFLVGLEVDLVQMRGRAYTAILTSHASILAPFLLGTALALWVYARYAPAGVGFTPFALFMGAAMSVTAFPVMARILAERGLTATPLGTLAITCAAVDDVSAWCILAAVVLVARAGNPATLALTLAGTAVYLAVAFTIGRRILARLAARMTDRASGVQGLLAVIVMLTLASAWITERLGIHALFGAFVVGATLPRTPVLVEALSSRIRDLMIVLLLPLYFAFTGLRTTVSLISGPLAWVSFAMILLVAIAGKLGGSAVAARLSGSRWRDALALGTLMNTRGLMELVILNVGLDIGVLSPPLFAMMVLMALVTTALTAPLLDALHRARSGVGDKTI
jgi:Kef-type K+ transport system membrane component KefB